ncbi:serine/threonine-protein phosphatase 2A 65 kDa regulatory subunit A beta isoform-like protein isoform X1 [Tanacetum coccineum]|uniref:Serine/threonine-protein phosphatase 2A 65 kDa regulatory subunit A beta isoform-like protein isoform X1 n=1 Tax=Tanacetum coccineum TaxID=301880 RepID=A0ABQ5EJZ3_9ASTR
MCVRDKAVELLCKTGSLMKETDLVDWFIPLRLAGGEWFTARRLAGGEWFTARVSACGLLHIAHPSAREMLKAELRTIYSQLYRDDMPKAINV